MNVTNAATVQLDQHSIQAPALRGVSHLIASVLALVGMVLLIHRAHGAREIWIAIVYGSMVALSMSTSFAYNRARPNVALAPAFRRADRAAIFGLIAGTYTPFLGGLNRTWSWTLLGTVWVAALLGALAMLVWSNLPRTIGAVMYLIYGWIFVAFIPAVAHRFGHTPAVLLILGGLFYSLGAVVYMRRRPNPSPTWFGYHEVFHLFVVAAVSVHFAAAWSVFS